jgi:hypothetical protein
MLRLAKFEELELTHTCCRKSCLKGFPSTLWDLLDDDEIDEIMDEEKEIIQDLEFYMRRIEHDLSPNLEEAWMKELTKLLVARNHLETSSGRHLKALEPPDNIVMMEYFQYLRRTISRENLKMRKCTNAV